MWRYVVWSLGLLVLAPALMAQERPKDSPEKTPATLSPKEQAAQLQQLDQKLAQLRQRIAETVARIEYSEPKTPAGPPEPREFVWIDDAPPQGANLQGNSPWEFVGKPQVVYSGEKSMRRSALGISQHFFDSASPGLKIGEGDKLFAYVYFDPKNLPKTIMLQFNDGTWEHRAFWGDDAIPWGAANSTAHRRIGELPKAGEWARLEVTAAEVGLKPGAVLRGWAFTQHDGTVHWDKAGIVTRTPQAGQSFASWREWEAFEAAQSESLVPPRVREAVKIEPASRNEAQKNLVRDYFLEHVYTKSQPAFEPLHKEIAALTQQRDELLAAEYRALLAELETALADSWTVLDLAELKSAGGATLSKQPDGSVLASGNNPPTDTYTLSAKTELKGIDGFRLEVQPHDSLPAKGPGRAQNGNFVLSKFSVSAAATGKPAQPLPFVMATATFSQDGYAIDQALQGVPQRGWAVSPRFGQAHSGIFELREPLGSGETTLTFSLPQDFGGQHTMGHFRISASTSWKAQREKFAQRYLEFADRRGDSPAVLDALMWVLSNVSVAKQVDRAIELIVKDRLEDKVLLDVCQRLANAPIANGEKLLRVVLEKSPYHDAKGWSCFALAKSIGQREGTDEKLQAQADQLLERAGKEFADVRRLGGSVHQFRRTIGRIAPEIEGEDIDGVKFKLSDYRGKVVVLDFWGFW